MTEASEDVFIKPLNALPSGGTMMRMACGSTTKRMVVVRPRPSARDASNCPRGMAEMPARMISAR